MSTPSTLQAHIELSHLYADYTARGVDQTLDPTDKEWRGDEALGIEQPLTQHTLHKPR